MSKQEEFNMKMTNRKTISCVIASRSCRRRFRRDRLRRKSLYETI
jgi:hypothetical protein